MEVRLALVDDLVQCVPRARKGSQLSGIQRGALRLGTHQLPESLTCPGLALANRGSARQFANLLIPLYIRPLRKRGEVVRQATRILPIDAATILSGCCGSEGGEKYSSSHTNASVRIDDEIVRMLTLKSELNMKVTASKLREN